MFIQEQVWKLMLQGKPSCNPAKCCELLSEESRGKVCTCWQLAYTIIDVVSDYNSSIIEARNSKG